MTKIKTKDTEGLKSLGSGTTKYNFDGPDASVLETFDNPFPKYPYEVEFITQEFSSLCPKTGQPDFAEVRIQYNPGKKCIESKSLKLYLMSYRNAGAFMERICNQVFEDLQKCCSPQMLRVTMDFGARGGIRTVVTRDTM
jgi:7-cyano-7-deazaguanine reductase